MYAKYTPSVAPDQASARCRRRAMANTPVSMLGRPVEGLCGGNPGEKTRGRHTASWSPLRPPEGLGIEEPPGWAVGATQCPTTL